MFEVGDHVRHYGVDHSPSYLWNAATWENSEALLPFLPAVLGGTPAWDGDETIRRAIEIRDGVVQKPGDPVVPAALGAVPARAPLARPAICQTVSASRRVDVLTSRWWWSGEEAFDGV